MNKYIKKHSNIYGCLVFVFCFFSVYAESLTMPLEEDVFKYKFSICAVFKNEEKYLEEWIEYHRIVGVEHFYLYNNGSIDGSVKVLNPYIEAGIVTLVDWPDRISEFQRDNFFAKVLINNLSAYENATKFLAVNETKWLMALEIDEFLVPVAAASILDVVQAHKDAPGLLIKTDFFDAFTDNQIIPRKLLVETIKLINEPDRNIEECVEKTLFKPSYYTSFAWPPYKCNFKENKIALEISRKELRINKYINRPKGKIFFGKRKDKLHVDNRLLSDKELKMLLDMQFEIDDQENIIRCFISELRKRLNRASGWEW